MKIDLTNLEIKILLQCSAGIVSKTVITQMFRRYNKMERAQAIDRLISKDFLLRQELPKLGSKKTPIFYRITEQGKKWIEEYNKNYPK
jgi:hypothetical protein